MSFRLRDEDAVRHPHGCEFCGKFRNTGDYEWRAVTRLGYELKVCADCAEAAGTAASRLMVRRSGGS